MTFGEDDFLEAQYEDRFTADTDLDDPYDEDDEEEDDPPVSYLDNVDGHWYVCRYDRTLPQIHARDCSTCAAALKVACPTCLSKADARCEPHAEVCEAGRPVHPTRLIALAS